MSGNMNKTNKKLIVGCVSVGKEVAVFHVQRGERKVRLLCRRSVYGVYVSENGMWSLTFATSRL